MNVAFSPYQQCESIIIKDLNQVGSARRSAMAQAQHLHFNETEAGKVGIIVTELATNLIKHASGGELLIRSLQQGTDTGLEIYSLDKGPGMADVRRCFEDGYSTGGSSGTGLGAIERQSSSLDLYSQPGKGTVLVSTVWNNNNIPSSLPIEIGAICRPLSGEKICGDCWNVLIEDNHIKVAVADGLGHGPIAARASQTAIEVVQNHSTIPLMQLTHVLHQSLLSTRGAAIFLADIDFSQELVRFVGIGNISAIMMHGLKRKGMASYNGTIGLQMHKAQELSYPCSAEALLLFHSDGLSERWKMEDYPGLIHRHPRVIAGVLYRDFQRLRDDATIVVLKKS